MLLNTHKNVRCKTDRIYNKRKLGSVDLRHSNFIKLKSGEVIEFKKVMKK
jgi:hypothetical protein